MVLLNSTSLKQESGKGRYSNFHSWIVWVNAWSAKKTHYLLFILSDAAMQMVSWPIIVYPCISVHQWLAHFSLVYGQQDGLKGLYWQNLHSAWTPGNAGDWLPRFLYHKVKMIWYLHNFQRVTTSWTPRNMDLYFDMFTRIS
jgi:hypothetical protein